MNYKPIIVLAGEPNSVFSEIFLKSMKKKIKSPIILIASKKLIVSQMNELGFKIELNEIDLTSCLQNRLKSINILTHTRKTTSMTENNQIIQQFF